MLTIQERRKHDLVSKLGRTIKKRDEAIKDLIRTTGQINTLTRAIARAEKRVIASRVAAPLPEPVEKPIEAPAVPAPLPADDMPDVPDFLKLTPEQRRAATDAYVAKVEAEQAAALGKKELRTKAKKTNTEAKLRGETRKMPLTGKAALAAIRG